LLQLLVTLSLATVFFVRHLCLVIQMIDVQLKLGTERVANLPVSPYWHTSSTTSISYPFFILIQLHCCGNITFVTVVSNIKLSYSILCKAFVFDYTDD